MKDEEKMENGVVIVAVGKDKPGLIAGVTGIVSEMTGNIEEMDQVVLKDVFIMSLIVKLLNPNFPGGLERMKKLLVEQGEKIGLKVHVYDLKEL